MFDLDETLARLGAETPEQMFCEFFGLRPEEIIERVRDMFPVDDQGTNTRLGLSIHSLISAGGDAYQPDAGW